MRFFKSKTPQKCIIIKLIMSVQDWFGLTLTALSILAFLVGGVKFLVKHYLSELRPNSGSSLKD
ncbi:hypothetical protein EB001_21480, partial [bacterium]|nr:hypothetical protein [bacterium]